MYTQGKQATKNSNGEVCVYPIVGRHCRCVVESTVVACPLSSVRPNEEVLVVFVSLIRLVATSLEPRMLVARVIRNEVENHPHAYLGPENNDRRHNDNAR